MDATIHTKVAVASHRVTASSTPTSASADETEDDTVPIAPLPSLSLSHPRPATLQPSSLGSPGGSI